VGKEELSGGQFPKGQMRKGGMAYILQIIFHSVAYLFCCEILFCFVFYFLYFLVHSFEMIVKANIMKFSPSIFF
jgi:hypothetical protein